MTRDDARNAAVEVGQLPVPVWLSDEITGHAPLTVGRGYGRPTLADMAAALKKFPRYAAETGNQA